MQAVPPGTHASSNSAMPSTNGYSPGPMAGTYGDPSSAAGFSQSPHGPLADETISLSSSPHSVGASRAALAGSSFADSEVSADRHHKLDLHSSAYDHSSRGGAVAGPAYEAGVGGFRPGVQVSSTPILGGEGTYTVQPLSHGSAHTQQQQQHMPAVVAPNQVQGQHSPARSASQFRQGYTPAAAPSEGSQGQYLPAGALYGQHQGGQLQPAMVPSDMTQRQASGMTQRQASGPEQADGSQNQEQYTPAITASGMSHAWAAPAAAASYSSFDSTESPPESGRMDHSSAIGVTRSPGGNDALQTGRAEAANSGLHHERSLRSFYSSGIAPCWPVRHIIRHAAVSRCARSSHADCSCACSAPCVQHARCSLSGDLNIKQSGPLGVAASAISAGAVCSLLLFSHD